MTEYWMQSLLRSCVLQPGLKLFNAFPVPHTAGGQHASAFLRAFAGDQQEKLILRVYLDGGIEMGKRLQLLNTGSALFRFDCAASDLQALAMQNPACRAAGQDLTQPIVIV